MINIEDYQHSTIAIYGNLINRIENMTKIIKMKVTKCITEENETICGKLLDLMSSMK